MSSEYSTYYDHEKEEKIMYEIETEIKLVIEESLVPLLKN